MKRRIKKAAEIRRTVIGALMKLRGFDKSISFKLNDYVENIHENVNLYPTECYYDVTFMLENRKCHNFQVVVCDNVVHTTIRIKEENGIVSDDTVVVSYTPAVCRNIQNSIKSVEEASGKREVFNIDELSEYRNFENANLRKLSEIEDLVFNYVTKQVIMEKFMIGNTSGNPDDVIITDMVIVSNTNTDFTLKDTMQIRLKATISENKHMTSYIITMDDITVHLDKSCPLLTATVDKYE